jgi:hypothetical protein
MQFMADDKQRIDAFLGGGWHDEWTHLDRRGVSEGKRFEAFRKRLHLPFASTLADRITHDLAVLFSISSDYTLAMHAVAKGRPPVKTKILQLHERYTFALAALEAENDMLEALFVTGLATSWVQFPFVLLEVAARRLQAALVENSPTLDTLLPDVSAVATATSVLGAIAVDRVLGQEEYSTEAAIATLKQLGDRIDSLGTLELEEAPPRVRLACGELTKLVVQHQPKLSQFVASFERWIRGVDDIRAAAGNMRQDASLVDRDHLH